MLRIPAIALVVFFLAFGVSLLLYKGLGFSYFPQTDGGQFVINFKAPSGTRLAVTEREAARMENLIRSMATGPVGKCAWVAAMESWPSAGPRCRCGQVTELRPDGCQ